MGYLVIKRFLGLPLIVALWSHSLTAATEVEEAPLVIRYPVLSEEYGQTRDDYFSRLLTLALDKTGEPYRLEPVTLSNFRESRSVMSVAKGVYDIHWMNTNATREAVLRPIRVPLFKGLIGWRLLLLRPQDENRFEGMSGLEPLKGLKAVQGHDWPDSRVLEANGLEVVRTPHWEGMFKMLYAGRVDYFPRSVLEVWDEQRAFEELNLVVDDHVVLYYPAAYYFFVRKESHELAALIEKGLDAAIADGSFDRLLMARFGDDIERANLSERRVIRLENPLLTPSTPLERKELWYQP